jgi:hypothetical protein
MVLSLAKTSSAQAVIAIKAHQDSEIVLVVSAG